VLLGKARGQTEIGEFDVTASIEEDIVGFDVAVLSCQWFSTHPS
jgi:hypothetical protein